MTVARFPALGTTAVIALSEPCPVGPARAALEHELAAMDRACSRFRDDSELTRLNRSAGRRVRVSPLLCEVLAAAVRAAEATDGLVDPTVGRALRLAGYDRTFRLVAARDGTAFAARFESAPVPGWRAVELDVAGSSVRVPPGTELDLGATAKALAADRGARAAGAAARCGVLVSLGGDIALAGPAPDGGWSVRVADDHAAPLGGPGPTVALTAGGLATSGTAVRRWRAGDAELHHLIDPRSGRSAETPWRTVSVAGASCVDANTASTAAAVLGVDAPAWLAARHLPARLVALDGVCVCVGGWPEDA
jgi:thiamine biosynthesis lipoprotein